MTVERFEPDHHRSEWERSLPELEPAALHGPAGAWATATAGVYSEASVAGTLATTIVSFGSAAGRGAYLAPGVTRHHTNESALLIGPSSTGRKGEAMELGLLPILHADEGFAERVMRGFGSGEALVDAVRDELRETVNGEEKIVVAAADDRRLLVREAEFAAVLTVAERRDSSLSGTIRAAWDGAQLANRTRRATIVASGAHVSFLAGITPTELVLRMSDDAVSNGFANRFLHVAVYRSAVMPSPPELSLAVTRPMASRFAEALLHARKHGQALIGRSPEAAERWDTAYREELSIDRYGLAGEVCARAEAHVLRLSLIYAMLDLADRVELEHVEAALALWRYCEASASLIYGRRLGIADADRLLDALEAAGPDGLTRDSVRERVFSKHGGAVRIDTALRPLQDLALVVERSLDTAGRPATIYVHADHAR